MEVSCPECGVLFMTDGPESPIPCPVCECEFDMPFDEEDWEVWDEMPGPEDEEEE